MSPFEQRRIVGQLRAATYKRPIVRLAMAAQRVSTGGSNTGFAIVCQTRPVAARSYRACVLSRRIFGNTSGVWTDDKRDQPPARNAPQPTIWPTAPRRPRRSCRSRVTRSKASRRACPGNARQPQESRRSVQPISGPAIANVRSSRTERVATSYCMRVNGARRQSPAPRAIR